MIGQFPSSPGQQMCSLILSPSDPPPTQEAQQAPPPHASATRSHGNVNTGARQRVSMTGLFVFAKLDGVIGRGCWDFQFTNALVSVAVSLQLCSRDVVQMLARAL